MSYSPIDPQATLHPGMIMATAIGSLGTNINEAWRYAWCPQAYSSAQAYHTGAAATYFWVRLRGNADQAKWRFRVFARALHNEGEGGTNEVRVIANSGASVLDSTITVVSSTEGEPQETGQWYTSLITDADTVDDPFDLRIQLYTSANELHVLAFAFYLEPQSAVGAGVLDSGFVRWDSSMNAVDDPISSEQVNRLVQAPYKIANDRPTTLYSNFTGYYDEDGAVKTYLSTIEATYQTIIESTVPGDGFNRTYRIDAYLHDEGRAGTDMSVRINIHGHGSITFTGEGWHTNTFSSSQESIPFSVQIKRNDGGATDRVSMPTLLIRREPV